MRNVSQFENWWVCFECSRSAAFITFPIQMLASPWVLTLGDHNLERACSRPFEGLACSEIRLHAVQAGCIAACHSCSIAKWISPDSETLVILPLTRVVHLNRFWPFAEVSALNSVHTVRYRGFVWEVHEIKIWDCDRPRHASAHIAISHWHFQALQPPSVTPPDSSSGNGGLP